MGAGHRQDSMTKIMAKFCHDFSRSPCGIGIVFVMIDFVMFLSCVHGGSLAHFVVRGFQFCHVPWSGLESPCLLDRNA